MTVKDITAEIKEKSASFSKGQRRIADVILTSYDKVAYMTAAKLGALVKVSESTVVRFADELGFSGYPEMQRALQEMARNRKIMEFSFASKVCFLHYTTSLSPGQTLN